jgi:hypothetical protein
MGNLIGKPEFFEWNNRLMDRNLHIDDLNAAIVEARKNRDKIFRSPDLFTLGTSWCNFYVQLIQLQYHEITTADKYPWLGQLQHTTLISIANFFQNETTLQSSTIEDLEIEFPGENNGHVGFHNNSELPDVYNLTTLYNFHKRFVATFNFEQRCNQFQYFKKFYEPALTLALNQIQNQINNGLVNPIIIRIDAPLIPFEKIHIHFANNQNCALNIDGSWKHKVNNFRIPVDVCEQLNEWGFLLPEEYYQ